MALILVTGANGKIGSRLVAALLSKGYKVRAVVRPGSKGKLPKAAEKYEHDLSIAPLPKEAFKGVQRVAHLAGLVGSHSRSALEAANAVAVNSLLYNCPLSLQRIVLASSISVYGEYRGKLVDESFKAMGESPYGKSKLLGENEARNFCPRLPITFLRIAMVYGPGFSEGYSTVLRYLTEGKMKIIGNGKNRMPLVYIDDVVRAFLLALSRPTSPCREYNICGEEKFTQEQLLKLASSCLGVPAPTKHITPAALQALLSFSGILGKKASLDPENIRQLTLDRAYSCKRAEKELGWKQKVKLKDGVREMVRIYKGKKAVE